jgi:F-type H+-transporting ATPase subunit delta
MAETTTVARPYARAAFEYAHGRKGGLKKWSQMLQLAADVARDPGARALFGNPEISDDDRVGLIFDIGGEKFDEAGRNFIKLLAENGRLAILPEIAAIFETLRAEAEKTIHAELTAAFALSEEQREKIAAALKGRLKRDVKLECVVDEALIGGAIIRAGDLIIDGSAKGQLAKLGVALRQ